MSDADIAQRFAQLSREQRAQLFQQLQQKRAGTPAALPPIRRQSRESNLFPVSFAQQRLWILDQLDPNSSLYSIPETFWIRGRLQPVVLERALAAIVARHESLRTLFRAEDGVPMQIIAAPGPVPLRLIDLRDRPQAERTVGALQIARDEACQPFDLARGPLLRALLLWLEDEVQLLVLTIHHIVFDGWSIGVLMRELTTLYGAFASGRPSPLADLPIQYADFAVWQRQRLQGELLEQQLAYWKQRLANLPTLQLLSDYPRPAVQSHRGATYTITLPRQLTEQLNALSQQEESSLFITTLAAFKLLLARYSGQDDIAVGTVIANRNRAEIEGLIGFFVNTLVLRTQLSGNPSFRTLIRRVREVALEAYAHQDLPFEKLVDELQLARDLSYTPLFQVLFALQNAPLATPQFSDITIDEQAVDTETAKFDLSVFVAEHAQGLRVEVEYATDLFEAATITRLVEHFQRVLEAVAADPDRRLSDISIMTEAEQRQLLVAWNATQAAYPSDSCLHQLIEAQAARTPDAIAVVSDRPTTNDQRPTTNDRGWKIEDGGWRASDPPSSILHPQYLTYRELDRRANQLAHYLQSLGVGPEVLVGICMERSLELVVGLLGILKAGGAYVPLDPAYPPERLAFMLADAAVSVLLTATTDHRPPTTDDGSPHVYPLSSILYPLSSVVDLVADWPTIAQERADDPVSCTRADNLAYVIYTSGSTGQPKGSLIAHRQVVRLFEATHDWFHFDAHDVWTFFHSYAFDFSVWELWGALRYGGRLVVVPYLTSRSPDAFYELLCAEGVTVLNQTPSAFRQLIYVEEQAPARASELRLRVIIFGGEALDLRSLAPWLDRHGDDHPHVVNMYGITETTVHVTYRPIRTGDITTGLVSPLGRPIPDLQYYLLDQHLNPVPIGVAGELYVGGAGLGRGYLNRPDLTAERFVPNPFAIEDGGWRMEDGSSPSSILHPPSSRLYRTGDLARYLANGEIEYLRRLDDQVKIRGFRIELGEIEAALIQHPNLRDVVVLAREDRPGEKRLVAYVVTSSELETDADPSLVTHHSSLVGKLRAFLKEKLPDYMIPAVFVTLAAMPLTANGKIDRRALPAPAGIRPDLDEAFVAPRTPAEEALATIWAAVLGLERVGVHDNFFALGGDSILNFKMIARAQQVGIHLTPKQIFQHQTIGELAAAVDTSRVHAEQGVVTGVAPLTPTQLWFLEQNYQHHDYFSIGSVLQVPDPLPLAQWQTIVQRLLLQHDALRIRLAQGQAGPYQIHGDPDAPLPLKRVDISGLADDQLQPLIRSVMIEQLTSLRMTEGSLVKVVLFDWGPQRPQFLILVCHHLIVDAFSWQILLADLDAAYRQTCQGEPIKLPPKTTEFKYWTERLVEYAQSAEIQAEQAYWLAEPRMRAPRLPLDYPDGANTFGSIDNVEMRLDSEATQALLREIPKAHDMQIDDLFLAALALGTAQWTESHLLLVEMVGHGRVPLFKEKEEDVDLSRTIGWLSIVFPVLVDLETASDPWDILPAIKAELRRVPNRGMGYGMLRYLSQDAEIHQRFQAAPRAQIALNYLGELYSGLARLKVIGGAGGPEHDPQGIRPHMLVVTVVLANNQLLLRFEYSRNLHQRSTIAALAERVMEALQSIIARHQTLR